MIIDLSVQPINAPNFPVKWLAFLLCNRGSDLVPEIDISVQIYRSFPQFP